MRAARHVSFFPLLEVQRAFPAALPSGMLSVRHFGGSQRPGDVNYKDK